MTTFHACEPCAVLQRKAEATHVYRMRPGARAVLVCEDHGRRMKTRGAVIETITSCDHGAPACEDCVRFDTIAAHST